MLEALRITLAGGHRSVSGAIRDLTNASLKLGVGTCQLTGDGQALRDHVVIAEPHERFGRPEDSVQRVLAASPEERRDVEPPGLGLGCVAALSRLAQAERSIAGGEEGFPGALSNRRPVDLVPRAGGSHQV